MNKININPKILKYNKLIQLYQTKILPKLILKNSKNYQKSELNIEQKIQKIINHRLKNYDFIIDSYKDKLQSLFLKKSIFLFTLTSAPSNCVLITNFFKISIRQSSQKIVHLFDLFSESKNLKPTVYFPILKNYRRSDIIKNKDFFDKKDFYKDKYQEKDLYTATLIPESGSWIRFAFQRDKKIDSYKYPITSRLEDDMIIQIDKLTKKPILHLLREMGLNDLEICQSEVHSSQENTYNSIACLDR